MRMLTAALVTAATLAVPAPAYASDPPASRGAVCSMVATSDPTGFPDAVTVAVWAGPVTITDPGTGAPRSGTVNCCPIVQVSDNSVECDDRFPGTGVVVGVPRQRSIQLTSDQNLYLCAQFQDDGHRYYWDDFLGDWTTDPQAECTRTVSVTGPGVMPLVDTLVCPVLQVVAPPYGDIPGVWYCSPQGLNPDTTAWFASIVAT
jgi:hypothetical protein